MEKTFTSFLLTLCGLGAYMSMNQFSNEIPREIGGLQNLVNLSLRHNKLQEAIPDTVSNMNLSSQFFTDNEALCGSSRFSVPSCLTSSKHKSNRKKLLVLYLFLALAILFVRIIFVFVWIRYKRGKRAPQQDDSLSTKKRERIPYYELLQPTDDLSESNLIGSGSFCSVYKGILNNGIFVAVKVFNLQQDEAFKSFDTEYEVLRSLRHRNRVKVITSCSNLDFKALINALLDENMVAHLSDFGISKLLGEDQGDLYTKTLATLGYIAPEYGLEGLVSKKCDVYSYGVMLLEPFTRRKPNEFEGDLSLAQWVSYSLPDAVMDVVDANLATPMAKGLQKELDVVASIMKVALDCCAESPARRTNMKDVVGMLQKIKIQLIAC
ncbi:hypothetical protein P3S68_003014 [Capsicum galapagoense]